MMAAHSARLIATEIIATGLLYRFIDTSLASRASSCVVVCTSNKAGARTRRGTMDTLFSSQVQVDDTDWAL